MTGDLEEMHEVIAHSLGQLTGAVTVMVVGAGYLMVVDLRMALVALSVLALMGPFYRISMRSMTTHMKTTHMNRLIAAEGGISAASVEYADGIQVVKAFGTGGRVLRRFDYAVEARKRVVRWNVAPLQSRVLGSTGGSPLMAPWKSRRRLRFSVMLTFLGGLIFAAILIAIGLPGDREVLVWGGNEVSSTDECIEIGGAGRRDSCGDIADTEVRYQEPNGWLMAFGGLVGAATLGTTGSLMRKGRRYYTIDGDGAESRAELEPVALLHGLGEFRAAFFASRGALVNDRELLIGQFESGLVRYDIDQRPGGYRWDEIESVRTRITTQFEERKYKGTEFEHVLTLADGAVMRTQGTYRDPQWDSNADASNPVYRFAVLIQAVNEVVSAVRLPAAREELAKGGSLDFDDIVVTTQHLRYQGSATPWAVVGAADIKNGQLTFPHIDRRSPVVRNKSVGKIPNLPLLLMLSDELRQSGSRRTA